MTEEKIPKKRGRKPLSLDRQSCRITTIIFQDQYDVIKDRNMGEIIRRILDVEIAKILRKQRDKKK